MTAHFNDYEKCAKEIIANVGKKIVIGVPLGLGKPIGTLNALFQLALNDSSIDLTILTGLTLAHPTLKNELEKRFVEPLLDRVLKDYEDPLYEKYRVSQQLPANIHVIEFFLTPGKFLHNAYVQQNYISSSYTSVVRDVSNLGINVLAQQVATSATQADLYSLSCNSDLFHGTRDFLLQSESAGKKIAIIAEINANLPFMHGELAEVKASIFTHVVDAKQYRSLFAIPRDEISMQDHLIGLYTSTLIKDDGCLQIGIGTLSNALANALIFRQRENDRYRELMIQLNHHKLLDESIAKSGSLDVFKKGLYASTEMLSDEYLQLYKEGILKKRVYDHIGLQTLLNNGDISETVTPEIIDNLINHHIIHKKISSADIQFLKRFGIFKNDISYQHHQIILASGESISADLTDPKAKAAILNSCLGDNLKSGKIIHAAFFFGSVDLYETLHHLPEEESQLIEMTAVARTNSILMSPDLFKLQRKNARFVNSSLMVTLVGGIISDGLKNYQELSGVGGQYDFVSMANQLPCARSIINFRATRETKGKVQSNIVWDYPNSTISRYLRDIIVTEYGVADCRSKTDAEVIKAILNIADSRFQPELLKIAKAAGKLQSGYQIPAIFQNNYPEAIEKIMRPIQKKGYCKPYPFGSDLTADEQILARALLTLKNASTMKLFTLTLASFFFLQDDAKFATLLQRMKLKSVKTLKEYIYKKLLKYSLHSLMKI